jgi:hypothetical protein
MLPILQFQQSGIADSNRGGISATPSSTPSRRISLTTSTSTTTSSARTPRLVRPTAIRHQLLGSLPASQLTLRDPWMICHSPPGCAPPAATSNSPASGMRVRVCLLAMHCCADMPGTGALGGFYSNKLAVEAAEKHDMGVYATHLPRMHSASQSVSMPQYDALMTNHAPGCEGVYHLAHRQGRSALHAPSQVC